MFCSTISLKFNTLAPVKAGIASKKEILLASTRSNLSILAAVIVMPALLTPGIKANTWKKPIYKIFLRKAQKNGFTNKVKRKRKS